MRSTRGTRFRTLQQQDWYQVWDVTAPQPRRMPVRDLWRVFGLELEESAAMTIQALEHAFDTPNRIGTVTTGRTIQLPGRRTSDRG
jgi:hypothetical protein